MTQFETFGLPAALNDALVRMNYKTATPIQAQAIPPALQGRDILGSAQTGTGKTAAFCIPLINHLMNDPKATALVMTPTRELAAQVNTVAQQMAGREHNIRTALLIGGDSMVKQFKQLNNRPRLIIGTPGRINDHLRRNRGMLEFASFVVLDEADRMLDMGFTIQIDEALKYVPKQRQMLMFSATMPHKIAEFSKRYMNNPVRVAVAQQQASADNITHEIVRVASSDGKYPELVKEIVAREGSIIIFVKTKRGADKMARRLQADSYDAEAIHGDLKQSRRNRVIADFRNKKNRILVATDVASRGLDVPHVEHVINYDLPQVAEDYIHRIGRTARAGAKGNALCLLMPSDGSMWSEISRLMNPGQPGERHEHRPERNGQKPRRSGEWRKHRNRRREDFAPDARQESRKDSRQDFRAEGFRRHKHGPKKPFRKDGPRFEKPRHEQPRREQYEGQEQSRHQQPRHEQPRQEQAQHEQPRHGHQQPRRDHQKREQNWKRREKPRHDRQENQHQQRYNAAPREDRRPPQAHGDNGMSPPRRRPHGPQNRHEGQHEGQRERQHPGGQSFRKNPGKSFRHRRDKRRDNRNAA